MHHDLDRALPNRAAVGHVTKGTQIGKALRGVTICPQRPVIEKLLRAKGRGARCLIRIDVLADPNLVNVVPALNSFYHGEYEWHSMNMVVRIDMTDGNT